MFDLTNWVHSFTGLLHFSSAVVGMLTGLIMLLSTKGTAIHKKAGYVFVVALLIVNISALFIYDFNDGSIGVFHFLIPVSLGFLLFGLIPMLGKRKPNAVMRHNIGMNGAELGLWAAGATEYFVRELSYGLNPSQLIAYSFLISVPFAVLITFSIIYHKNKYKLVSLK